MSWYPLQRVDLGADPGIIAPTALPAPAPAPAPVATSAAPSPPATTDWTLVIVSGVAVSVITSLFFMSVRHAHKAITKSNRELARKR